MNGKRKYESPARENAAEETRAAIRRSARELFVEQGFVATTMKQIALAASVAERTLYLAFPTKAALLNELIVRAVRGQESEDGVADLPDFADTTVSWSADQAIGAFVDATTNLYARAGALLVIGEHAAAVDPELKAFAEAGARDTLRHIRTLTDRLAVDRLLRPGLTPQHAADITYCLSHFTTYHLFTVRRRWSRRQYRTWLRDVLIETITNQAP